MLPFVHSHFGRGQRAQSVPILAGKIDKGAPAGSLNLAATPGPAPGDMMIVSGSVSGGAGVAWTALPSGGRLRRLVAGDWTTPLNFGTPVAWSIYRGPVSAVVRSSRSGINNHAHPGFTKSPYCVGLALVGRGDAGTTAQVTLSAPWTLRAGSAGSGPSERVWDLLDPALYVDGTTVNASTSSNPTSYSDLLELTF